MDIHRCRFVDYPPSAINALAFSHTSGSASRNQPLRLAIGRANGDIEIWDPRKGAWIHETTFRSGRGRSVEGLVWTHDPDEVDAKGFVTHGRLRLFSIGYSSSVTEWDLHTGLPLRESGGPHSEVWCLTAQPRREVKKIVNTSDGEQAEEPEWQKLVAGCADGTLVMLSTENEGLSFQKYIARASKKNARALSLAFQNRDTVVVGFADSTIRVYDIRNGSLLRNMSLGGGSQGGPKEKLVWAVDCLKDGTIVSGDSTGEVVFWDGRTYGQLQRIKGHEADVLCLTTSEDGTTIISGGMDRRTVVYNLVGGGQTGQRKRWAETTHRRFHQHDVKAMARFENSKMSVVVSGGLDTRPVVIPLRDFGKEYHHALPYTPQHPPVAGSGRCIVSWWNNTVTIWRVNRRKPRSNSTAPSFTDNTPNYNTVAQLALKGDEHVSAATISLCGTLLAVATAAQTKLFHLVPREGPQRGTLKIKKLDTPAHLANNGARLIQFSPDSKWLLCVGLNNSIHLLRITPNTDSMTSQLSPQILPTTTQLNRRSRSARTQNCLNGPWGSYDGSITRAAFSTEARILAVSDLGGRIDTWILEGEENISAPPSEIVRLEPNEDDDGNMPSETESDTDSDAASASVRGAAISRGSRKVTRIYGQYWKPNPVGHLLPTLPAAPIILSFRPPSDSKSNPSDAIQETTNTLTNGTHKKDTSVPAIRTTDSRLFILTSTHIPYEIDILSGRFTPWSRYINSSTTRGRAPGGLLDEFRLQRDRAVGCIWDVQPGKWERVWLYGAAWLGMLDLAQSNGTSSSEEDENDHVELYEADAMEVDGEEDGTRDEKQGEDEDDMPTTNKPNSKKRKRGVFPADNSLTRTTSAEQHQSNDIASPRQQLKIPQEPEQAQAGQAEYRVKAGLALKRGTTGLAGSRVRFKEQRGGAVSKLANSKGGDGGITRLGRYVVGDEDDERENDDDEDIEEEEADDDVDGEEGEDDDDADDYNSEDYSEDDDKNANIKPRPKSGLDQSSHRTPNPHQTKSKTKTKPKPTKPPAHHLTNRYRPILAIIPLINTPFDDALASESEFESAFGHEEGAIAVNGDDHGHDEDDLHDEDEETPRLGVHGVVRRGGGNGRGYGGACRGEGGREENILEVAVIERPLWDLDLPGRFAGR